MPTGNAYSSGQLIMSFLGLAYINLLVETNPLPNLSLFFGLCPSNIHRYFFFILLKSKEKQRIFISFHIFFYGNGMSITNKTFSIQEKMDIFHCVHTIIIASVHHCRVFVEYSFYNFGNSKFVVPCNDKSLRIQWTRGLRRWHAPL